jgi:hypothetical protein
MGVRSISLTHDVTEIDRTPILYLADHTDSPWQGPSYVGNGDRFIFETYPPEK